MENYAQADDYGLWMIIENGPLIPKKVIEDEKIVPKKPQEFNADDFKMMEKDAKAKKLLYFGLGPDEYTRISECESAKEIKDAIRVAYEGTNRVKQSRIDLLMRKYEQFKMGDKETVMEKCTRFTHITNELKILREVPHCRGIGEENPPIFAIIMGSKSHGHLRSKEYERDFLGRAYRKSSDM